jgi:hypothetical protein
MTVAKEILLGWGSLQLPDKVPGLFFETRDMLYILAGHGARKTAGKPALEALMNHCRVEAPL